MANVGTWTDLATLLRETEREIAETHSKADLRVRQCEQKVAAINAKSEEAEEQHRHAVQDIMRRSDLQVEAMMRKTDVDLAATKEATSQMAEQTKEAEERRKSLQARARALEQEVKELHILLTATSDSYDKRYNEAREAADSEVGHRMEATRQSIEDISTFATEARDGVNGVMDNMQDSLERALGELHARSAQRSRYQAFKELRSQTQEDDNSKCKRREMVKEWLDDWQTSLPSLATISPPSRSGPVLQPVRDKRDLLEVSSARRKQAPNGTPALRAKDRALAQAGELQQQRSIQSAR